MKPELAQAVASDWIEALQGFPQEVVAAARADWVRNEHRRPTPADIVRLCRERMPRPRIVPTPEAPPDRITPEAAREILAQTGWDRRLIKKMPRSGEEAGGA